MISAANPNGAFVFQFLTAQTYPFLVKRIYLLGRPAFVPLSFVHTYHLASLIADAIIGKKVRWVGEYHVKLEVELRKQLKVVAII